MSCVNGNWTYNGQIVTDYKEGHNPACDSQRNPTAPAPGQCNCPILEAKADTANGYLAFYRFWPVTHYPCEQETVGFNYNSSYPIDFGVEKKLQISKKIFQFNRVSGAAIAPICGAPGTYPLPSFNLTCVSGQWTYNGVVVHDYTVGNEPAC